jgi:hypothetical protein
MAVLMRNLKRSLIAWLVAFPSFAHAHKVWLLPSQTVLANEAGWITVDAAISNDLFFYNWHSLPLVGLSVTAPEGSLIPPQNTWQGKFRSSFEVELKQRGTHRIAVYAGLLMAHFELAGEEKRWRGPIAEFAAAIPANATKLEVAFDEFRIESFVTVGRPTPIPRTGKGLELVGGTHPNDLAADEAATFMFLLDGQPAATLDVSIVAGNTRYRDTQDEMKLKTDSAGAVVIRWPAAGMYWLEVTTEDQKSPVKQANKRYVTYIGTFEVL